MTTAAPAWRRNFYPLWPELREMIAEKYAEAGVGKDIFYYVICMFPGKENLAMRKASERRSNYNGHIKTYGRGPGGCVPESKWKELADEGVAPQCSRSPSEWTLFYLHGDELGFMWGCAAVWKQVIQSTPSTRFSPRQDSTFNPHRWILLPLNPLTATSFLSPSFSPTPLFFSHPLIFSPTPFFASHPIVSLQFPSFPIHFFPSLPNQLWVYGTHRCTAPTGVRHPQVYGNHWCTAPTGVRHPQVYGTHRCTTPTSVGHPQVYGTQRCVQNPQVYGTHRCTAPTGARRPQVYGTHRRTAPTGVRHPQVHGAHRCTAAHLALPQSHHPLLPSHPQSASVHPSRLSHSSHPSLRPLLTPPSLPTIPPSVPSLPPPHSPTSLFLPSTPASLPSPFPTLPPPPLPSIPSVCLSIPPIPLSPPGQPKPCNSCSNSFLISP
ncbi:unnamed protein product [Closterium sp. NIES-64]|nr:unnamed protein product [Closterium sp. NIES-64]